MGPMWRRHNSGRMVGSRTCSLDSGLTIRIRNDHPALSIASTITSTVHACEVIGGWYSVIAALQSGYLPHIVYSIPLFGRPSEISCAWEPTLQCFHPPPFAMAVHDPPEEGPLPFRKVPAHSHLSEGGG